jgi:predicted amidophosphoribosyltransferase
VPVKINPRKLRGPWAGGYALDLHTTGSTFLGQNAFGHSEFDTRRSPLGDLLYRLKNAGDQTVIPEIVETAAAFIKTWSIEIDSIVPVPPSNMRRKHQPVIDLATTLSSALLLPISTPCITKLKSTEQLKDISDHQQRAQILKDAFTVDVTKTTGKRLLLFDDVYRSGATAAVIARLLTGKGTARVVYLLTLTQTRKLT